MRWQIIIVTANQDDGSSIHYGCMNPTADNLVLSILFHFAITIVVY